MNITINHSHESTELVVGGAITLTHAAELRQQLLDALNQSPALALTMDQITEADISFPQLLCATHYAALLSGKTFTVAADKEGVFGRLRLTAGLVRQHSCGRLPNVSCLWMEGV